MNLGTVLYQTNVLPIGVEVLGISLNQPIGNVMKYRIMKDVTKHRIMVFRNQGVVSGEKQVEISRWFGEIDNTAYTKHPSSPSIDIFRVSNDASYGCTGVGMSGWHIDGTFRKCPYAYSVYHMVSPPKTGGDTMFIPLTEIVKNLSPEKRSYWDSLWMISDRLGNICHPLIYCHPKTGQSTLCFHQGMTNGFVRDYEQWIRNGSIGQPDVLDKEEAQSVLDDIQSEIDKTTKYSHQWRREGDFIISDNLAVGHMAGPISKNIREAGLRILHRVTVQGTVPPSKQCDFDFSDQDNCAYG